MQSVESEPKFRSNTPLHLRDQRISQARNQLATCFILVSCLANFSTLNIEGTCSSETPDQFQRTALRYIPEDRTRHSHRRENLKSYILMPNLLICLLLFRYGMQICFESVHVLKN
jgi:hypothetical protein